nr:uncharacterized protein LOC119163834 isoform X3 [Rhipicephalus microplus]
MLLVLLLVFAHFTSQTVVDALGVPYSLVVLGHDDLVNDKTTRIWDADDGTCFSMPLELNETLASVRLFLDPPIDIGLVRVVSKPHLLPQTSGRAASSRQQVTTGKLSWRLILYATLPVMAVAAILAAVLFWKRKKVPCLRASYASGLHPAKRQGRRSLPLTPDDEEDSLGHVRHQRHGSSFPQPHLRPARMDPITQEQASSRLESPTSYPTWNLPTTCSKCLMNMPRWSLRPKGTPASRTEMSELQGKIATDPSFCVTLH